MQQPDQHMSLDSFFGSIILKMQQDQAQQPQSSSGILPSPPKNLDNNLSPQQQQLNALFFLQQPDLNVPMVPQQSSIGIDGDQNHEIKNANTAAPNQDASQTTLTTQTPQKAQGTKKLPPRKSKSKAQNSQEQKEANAVAEEEDEGEESEYNEGEEDEEEDDNDEDYVELELDNLADKETRPKRRTPNPRSSQSQNGSASSSTDPNASTPTGEGASKTNAASHNALAAKEKRKRQKPEKSTPPTMSSDFGGYDDPKLIRAKARFVFIFFFTFLSCDSILHIFFAMFSFCSLCHTFSKQCHKYKIPDEILPSIKEKYAEIFDTFRTHRFFFFTKMFQNLEIIQFFLNSAQFGAQHALENT